MQSQPGNLETQRPLVVLVPLRAGQASAFRLTLDTLRQGSTRKLQVTVAASDEEARQEAAGDFDAIDSGAAFGHVLKEVCRRNAGCDIVCVMPGVRLPFAWDARLAKTAYAEPAIAAALPLCDASPLHQLVDESHRDAAAAHVVEIDDTVYCMGQRGYYDAPSMHAWCVYFRRDALESLSTPLSAIPGDAAAVLDRLAALWRAQGRAMVLCDFLYVGAPAGEPVAAARDEKLEQAAFALHHPLGGLRRAVNEALARGLAPVSTPALDARPVQLHVMHFWGGGIDKWVRDFCRADTSRTNLILATYRIGDRGGQRLVLYSDPDAKVPVHTWDIARPLPATAVRSLEYRAILEQIVTEFDVEAIVVSSLIGHSLDALSQPVKTIVVSHDFYPVCPNINPRFDELCAGCTAEDIARCLPEGEFRKIFGETDPGYWKALRDAYVERLLEGGVQVVVPSASVASTLKRLEPRLDAVAMRVIPHGIDFPAAPLPAPAVEPSQRVRLAVLGRLNAYKGLSLLTQAGAALSREAEVTLVGCGREGTQLASDLGWKAIDSYELAELPGLLASIAPHAALLPSVVPESFSYTLSELWALAIPPLATDLGAFHERIRHGETGFLFEPRPEALIALVQQLRAQPGLLAHVAQGLAERPAMRTSAEMVADYDELLPRGARAVARFRVGVGRETALTEPYRLLNEAYSRLSGAYEALAAAYRETQGAYERTREEFERVHGQYEKAHAEVERLMRICETYAQQLHELRVGTRWWLAPKAERLVEEMRRKIGAAAEADPTIAKPEP